ncbi:MAG: patatin-like phospholipase family protein [Caldilinea sp.]|nr:patatin-like phospholipase family protein [Caldilinea sp.]MCB0147357.1 patatin-like phospholipase family protein [Caldilineaceae bacterium]MCB0038139.1 patatin-like phospholipase family protein [Caldilinea sp.]MCB9115712.1 patatin-like phospholipase family protein [Caldilineaceae bacterium]MCB9120641.1 patatin-like phospholipase family protein [Caldilineaceae bacterium]
MSLVNDRVLNRRRAWDEPPRPHAVGLVLGGGAARGIAHVGALQALEEQEIFPDVIVGTSVGALVGGLYAAGVSAARLRALIPTISWFDLVSLKMPGINLTDIAKSLPLGLLDLDKMIPWINSLVGSPVAIEELNLPFAAIGTDLLTGEIVVMNKGPLAPAIRASCGVPGVFTPYRRNGRLLVDGVVANNLPVNVAQDLGADYVIAVDLLPMNAGQEMERQAEPRNLAEVAMTALFMLARATQIEQALADVVISPAVAHINLADLTASEALLDAGYKAMVREISRIKADLMR